MEYVDKLLELRTSRLESIAASVRELNQKKRGLNAEVLHSMRSIQVALAVFNFLCISS